jgi:regulator of cell morphogenesis and NO signaling
VNINPSTSIGEIAVQLPRATKVFEDLKIDYCCGGAKPLGEACESAGLSVANVVQMLETVDREGGAEQFDPRTASLIRLIMHILDKHHVYVKKEMAHISGLLPKVVGAHGRRHPELLKVASVFRRLCEDIKPHMFKEEQIFFPYIVELERSLRDKTPRPIAPFGTAASPIRTMAAEHSEAGVVLRDLRRLTSNYTVPDDGCLSFHALYEALKAFEEDLHQHIHLENNVLFPRAIEMEDGR